MFLLHFWHVVRVAGFFATYIIYAGLLNTTPFHKKAGSGEWASLASQRYAIPPRMKKWKRLREFHERALFHISFENVSRLRKILGRREASLGYCSFRVYHLSLGNYRHHLLKRSQLTCFINLSYIYSIHYNLSTKVRSIDTLFFDEATADCLFGRSVCDCSLPISVCTVSWFFYTIIDQKSSLEGAIRAEKLPWRFMA